MTELLNVRQTAELLGVHENTVRNWTKSGLLTPAQRLPSGYARYDRQAVEALAADMKDRDSAP